MRRKKISLREIIVLICIIGAGYYVYTTEFSGEKPKTPVTYVSLEEVKPPFVVVDSRDADTYSLGHHPKAININKSNFTSGYIKLLGDLVNGYSVIVYGDPENNTIAENIASQLMDKKMDKVFVFTGSYEELAKVKQ